MLEFKRKVTFQGDSVPHDLLVTAVPSGRRSKSQYQICFRIGKDAMQKLRLLHSDRVTVSFDEENRMCYLTRVADETGNKISTRHTKGDTSGQVRFSCTESDLVNLGLVHNGKRSGRIVGNLLKEEGRTAVFSVAE